ncbi:DUF4363 family protein [Alkalihalobacillus hemicellulosilyticus]|uniref:Lipoprotein n=1 Tax=Halalkalibacter hemicellulosilyticusJCM 9152 TaxID=1236971 RepID=W4QCK5_9BACI|nr:DUF4363 family protein [Halalkalibacter hemicellulosilyticus]GAE29786.1 hypothetical protein JCM9152_1169 [Halalkalibacter hemicellulosilyticusJCM 9152]
MLMRIKQLIGIAMLILLITGCNVEQIVKTEKDHLLFQQTSILKEQIENEEWDEVSKSITHFEKNYSKRKWKLQLLAAIGDYQDIELHIVSLKEYAKDEDKVESLTSISQIRHLLTIIYNL